MKHHYHDIRSKLDDDPDWWDEVGVPRYCEFAPSRTNVVYTEEVALLEIACQGCDTLFRVAMSWSSSRNWVLPKEYQVPPLSERIQNKIIHYGDPPNSGCCTSGATMNSIPLRVLEFWQQDERFVWWRKTKYEVELAEKPGEGDDVATAAIG